MTRLFARLQQLETEPDLEFVSAGLT
jgi:hypothetical protein